MGLIARKHVEHIAHKQILDPRARMVLVYNVGKRLQKRAKVKNPRNDVMCKDKWNSLNSNFKKLIDYHKGTSNHTCFWDLKYQKNECYYLLHQYTRGYYEFIEVFQGEKNVNALLHTKDVNAEGDDMYKPSTLQET